MRTALVALFFSLITAWPGSVTAAETAASGDFRVVTATGVGRDPKEALNSAFSAAVEQVVGTLVDAQTLVRQGDQVEQRILTASNGFIESYDKVREYQEGGLFRCKIKARVHFQKLKQGLESAGVSMLQVRGTDLAAEYKTRKASAAGLAELIFNQEEEIRKSVLRLEATGKPVPSTGSRPGLVKLTLPVRLWFDQEAYKRGFDKLVGMLEKAGVSRKQVRLRLDPRRDQFETDTRDGLVFFSQQDFWFSLDDQQQIIRLASDNRLAYLMPVLPTGSTGYIAFELDTGVLESLRTFWKKRRLVLTSAYWKGLAQSGESATLRLTLLDKAPSEIDTLETKFTFQRSDLLTLNCAVDSSFLNLSLEGRWVFEIQESDLESLGEIKLSASFDDSEQ